MPGKTILFILVFAGIAGGAVFFPLLGVLGYVVHYAVAPESRWWTASISEWGVRYAYSLGFCTALGALLKWRRLGYGRRLMVPQEWLVLAFLGLMWALYLFAEPTRGRYTWTDHPTVKMLKVVAFVFLLTHIVTKRPYLDGVLWALVVGALALGIQAYITPRSAFASGRLETVGGPDFRETNGLGAYLVAMLPIIGVLFLRAKWFGKVLCLAAAGFVTNAIILTRSRGAAIGALAAGLVAAALAPRKQRPLIFAGLIVAAVVAYSLSDQGFVTRITTIKTAKGEMDSSSRGRVEIWTASVDMLIAHPFGVGPGNFYQYIGQYNADFKGRDAHNTFVRCYGDLGIPGLMLFVALVVNGVVVLRRVVLRAARLPPAEGHDIVLTAWALVVSLGGILVVGCTVTLIYMEGLWWLLALPVCLERVVANLEADHGLLEEVGGERTAGDRVRAREPAPAGRA